MRAMFAVIWHFWLGVALTIGAVLTVVAMVAGYFRSVESQRYPKGR
jgi:amino acid permease